MADYLLIHGGSVSTDTPLARDKIAAAGEGWTGRELPTTHVPMATMPERLAKLRLEAAE